METKLTIRYHANMDKNLEGLILCLVNSGYKVEYKRQYGPSNEDVYSIYLSKEEGE